MLYRSRQGATILDNKPVSAKPLDTAYAAAYRSLIRAARTNGIRLVLANFSMAVNEKSDPCVIEFYRAGTAGGGSVYPRMKANVVHSALVQQLAEEHPEVCLVNTHPGLDGEHEKFIDIIHFTQEGRQQLAENMFAGIRKVLEEDLSVK